VASSEGSLDQTAMGLGHIHGGKDIENRRWLTRYRGPLLIHAGKRLASSDFERVCSYLAEDDIEPPKRSELMLGGIIGQVDLVDCVVAHESAWFDGPIGWVLSNPRPLRFHACKGQLKLFELRLP
jgi:hypothetical protein